MKISKLSANENFYLQRWFTGLVGWLVGGLTGVSGGKSGTFKERVESKSCRMRAVRMRYEMRLQLKGYGERTQVLPVKLAKGWCYKTGVENKERWWRRRL